MTSIRWAQLALVDLEAIDTYYRQMDEDLADRMSARIVGATAFLRDMPRGGPIDSGSRRRWQVSGTPYLLFYRIESDHVRVLRVRHAAQNPLR